MKISEIDGQFARYGPDPIKYVLTQSFRPSTCSKCQKRFKFKIKHHKKDSFIPIPEIVWYVLLTEFQSLVKNSNFEKKIHWSEISKIWKFIAEI